MSAPGTVTVILYNKELDIEMDFRIYYKRWDDFLKRIENVKNVSRITTNDALKKTAYEDPTNIGINGSTYFMLGTSTHTYDRTGVEDSFYISDDTWSRFKPTREGIDACVAEQIERVEKSRSRDKTTIRLPGVLSGWKLTTQEIEKYKEKLFSGNSISFTPSGFGTGYTISPKRQSGFGWSPASADLKTFFGVDTLFISSFDAD